MPISVKCPICKREVQWTDNPSRPFCSERCRLIDLGAWSSGDYRVPGEGLPQAEESEE
ncbi:MAG TPA: DNA gyrase inhibitor YacG [Geobacteraceae bacterium]|nr:DNA gyrase inhibitor YacG [Geobacteraceae bacterium]